MTFQSISKAAAKTTLAIALLAGISAPAFATETAKPAAPVHTISAAQIAEFKDTDCTTLKAEKSKECEAVKEHIKKEEATKKHM